MKNGKRNYAIPLLLFAAVFVTYWQVHAFDFVNYDDPDYVANAHSTFAQALTSTAGANWIPLTRVSHLLDYRLFGLNSGAQHLTNVLLHALNAVLLFALLFRMTRAQWPSAFAAAVFALHPLHIESVAWVAERKDVLSTLFLFLALWAYLNYVDRPEPKRYLLVAALFLAALLAKPMVVTFPFLALLLDVWPLRRFSKRAVLEKLPLLAISLAAAAVTYLVQQRGGAVESFDQIPFGIRAGNALVSYAVYLGQFLWPANLAVFNPYTNDTNGSWIFPALLLAAITAVSLRFFKTRPYLAIGWFWFLGALVPAIGLIQVGLQSHADRYTYVPTIGLSIMLAWGLPNKKPFAAAAVLACCAWTYVTYANLANWRDSVTLFQHAIEVTSNNYVAYNNLGAALLDRGDTAQAAAGLQEALRIRPNYAEAQNNLGQALLIQDRFEEAAPYVQAALRAEPDSAAAQINWAAILNSRGQIEEAAAQDRAALKLDPDSAEAHCGLGTALLGLGRNQEALDELREAIAIKPAYADAHYNLGVALGSLERTGEAIAEFTETVRLQPQNAAAHFNLGTAYAAQDRLDRSS